MRVLSGFQPSGKFHLGNYFGSILPNIEFQKKSDVSFFMVADLHSLTSLKNPIELRESILDNVLDFLACGLDTEHSILFRQSDIPAHAELTWILSTITPMGLLDRAVSYKEKVEKGIMANAGLFTYPILQTADIVLYDIDKVPVGKDQKQHLEMARDISMKFNNTFGKTLVVPEGVIDKDCAVVPGIDGQKMSKSYGNTIPLFGEEKEIKKAIMRIVTDSRGARDPKDPDTCTIYQIHKLFLDLPGAQALAEEYRNGLPYGDAKKQVFEAYMEYFAPMRERRLALKKREDDVLDMLREGAKRALVIANETLKRAKRAVGLL